MTITVKSKIQKGFIRIPSRVRLPEGTPVVVKIDAIPESEQKLKIASELCGTWSNDPTIIPIF